MENKDVSRLSSRLEEEFTCLVSSSSIDVQYIDNEALTHMNGVQEYFLSDQEEEMDFQITIADRTKCTLVRRCTITFHMEAGTNNRATKPGLGMNLISVSQLQENRYNVYFIRKKVYVKNPSWKTKRQIGSQRNRLQRLHLKSPMALIRKNINGEKELNELWHR